MNNPYADQEETVDFQIGRRSAYALIYCFLLLITLPPLYRNVAERFAPVGYLFRKDPDVGIAAHLKAAEGKIEDAPFAEPPRKLLQNALTRGPLREGNRKTHIGRDGWLYYSAALDALTGYGPLRAEPDSVAKDPNRELWRSPLAAISRFAEQLAGTDTELLLVPIPVKPMIYPEHLGLRAGAPLAHPDAPEFYAKLNAMPGVTVLDLADAFWNAKGDGQLFLKQDTHWTPEGMGLAAERVAAEVQGRVWYADLPKTEFAYGGRQRRASTGDLVEKLDIGAGGFAEEEVWATPVEGATFDPSSPIVLLGDSFTNIYSDTLGGLKWGVGAGFGEHLAARLGLPVDLIAVNGQAASGVREQLAKRKGAAALMRDKRLVIWAIAARDLFLSESAAAEADVEWRDVEFDTREPEPPAETGVEPSLVKARLVKRSPIDDPKTTPYTALIYVCEYELIEALGGAEIVPEDGRVAVAHWAFRERRMLPSSEYEIGAVREMALVPFDGRPEQRAGEISADTDLFDFWWEVEAPAEAGADPGASRPEVAAEARPARAIAAAACGLYALLLGAIFWRRGR